MDANDIAQRVIRRLNGWIDPVIEAERAAFIRLHDVHIITECQTVFAQPNGSFTDFYTELNRLFPPSGIHWHCIVMPYDEI